MRENKGTNEIRIRYGNAEKAFSKWLSVFLCVVFACSLLAGCSKEGTEPAEQGNNEAEAAAETAVIPEDIVIHTDYGDLHYPDRWQEYVTIRQEQKGSGIAVTFETQSGEGTYALFDILIGGDGSDVVGSLTDSTGTQRNVCLHVDELPADSGLEESEQTRFYAMQEDLNYLIDHLK